MSDVKTRDGGYYKALILAVSKVKPSVSTGTLLIDNEFAKLLFS